MPDIDRMKGEKGGQMRCETAKGTGQCCCRGPGQALGKQQSGKGSLGCLRAADLVTDSDLLEQARKTAMDLLIQNGMDPDQWFKPLLAALRDRCAQSVHPILEWQAYL